VSENSDGYLDFNMHAINVALVNAVKELDRQLTATVAALDAKSREVSVLSGEVGALRSEPRELRSVVIEKQSAVSTTAAK
jgi:hypothetical protein